MTDIGPVYVSDGAIIAWLEEKQTEQNSELSSMMSVSNDRTELTQSLTKLKQDIDQGTLPPQDLLDEMQSIQSKYKNTDLGSEVDALILPMEAKVAPVISTDPNSAAITQTQAAIDASSLPDDVKAELDLTNQLANAPATQGTAVQVPGTPNLQLAQYKDDWDTNIQSEVDKLGKIDQLDLIKINELVADSRQTMELGSNLLSARDQTNNLIISNIGRA
jgi:hypothetical protein